MAFPQRPEGSLLLVREEKDVPVRTNHQLGHPKCNDAARGDGDRLLPAQVALALALQGHSSRKGKLARALLLVGPRDLHLLLRLEHLRHHEHIVPATPQLLQDFVLRLPQAPFKVHGVPGVGGHS